jgi:hypothetical protein
MEINSDLVGSLCSVLPRVQHAKCQLGRPQRHVSAQHCFIRVLITSLVGQPATLQSQLPSDACACHLPTPTLHADHAVRPHVQAVSWLRAA